MKLGDGSGPHPAHDCHSWYPSRYGFRRTFDSMDPKAALDGEQPRRRGAPEDALGTRSLGRLGEQLAANHLARRGFAILQRNYRTRWGEIDIVAFDGHTLVFCEVKSRRSGRVGTRSGPAASGPFESLHPRKRAQVRRMATSWMREQFERPFAAELRFDAIGVTLDRRGALVRLEHLEGAF